MIHVCIAEYNTRMESARRVALHDQREASHDQREASHNQRKGSHDQREASHDLTAEQSTSGEECSITVYVCRYVSRYLQYNPLGHCSDHVITVLVMSWMV